ncbi:MAG: dihydrofolate reductase [Elusimicrobia bacterium]|nr:dihydrofolate reductase [Elusimicrobiota bacterium]
MTGAPKLAVIAAMTEARVIGRKNRLPWHLPEDLKRFKSLTMGHPIIMGRKTFESIGKALPGRRNIVVTSTRISAAGVQAAASLETALAMCPVEEGTRFVIGGARLFAEALPLADRLYITLIHADLEGDVVFPPFELEKSYRVVEKSEGRSAGAEALPYTFLTADRV